MEPSAHHGVIAQAIAQQLSWANRTGRAASSAGASLTRPEDALFTGFLDDETYAELAAGAGGELKRLVSLRSSSCLAVNVFASWRANPAPIARMLGGDPDAASLSFERKFPTGLRGTSPHLDVVIGGDPLVAIESKFLESYSPAGNTFADAYFSRPSLWDAIPNLRRLAEDIATGRQTFAWLHAAQLIKHALGLRLATDRFRLLLVWYRLDSPISTQIDIEIQRFSEQVAADIDFEAMTYQQLATSLAAVPEPAPGYLAYLKDRYSLEGPHD